MEEDINGSNGPIGIEEKSDILKALHANGGENTLLRSSNGGNLKEEETSNEGYDEADESKNNDKSLHDAENLPSKHAEEQNTGELKEQKHGETESSVVEQIPPSSPPKSKKRLTLQERLEMAAKGRSRKPRNKVTSVEEKPKSKTGEESKQSEPVKKGYDETSAQAVEAEKGFEMKLEDDGKAEQAALHVNEHITDNSNSDIKLSLDANENKKDKEIESLKMQIEKLTLKNLELKDQVQEHNVIPPSSSFGKEKKDLIDKIASKDETIKQLMEEGQALSMKELKLNETIKKLRSLNSNLEDSLNDFSEKNEKISLKQNELEEILRLNKFKSIDQLIEKFNENSNTINQLTQELEGERNANWMAKYKEQQKIHEATLLEKQKYLQDLNELKIQFDMSKRQSQLDLSSKNTIIQDLKREISNTKGHSSSEIARLEAKIEQLRFENEKSQHLYKNEPEKGAPNTIDYEDYSKLSEVHHNLQEQYLSSQENWKLIESNLLNKVDNMSSSLESLKKQKIRLSNELKKHQSLMQNQTDEYNVLKNKLVSLEKENEDTKLKLQILGDDYQEQVDKFERLNQIYNTDRQKLNNEIKRLTEDIEKSKEPFEHLLTVPLIQNGRRSQETGLHLGVDPPRSPTRTNSINNSSWNEIKFGESSTTPAIQKDFTGIFMNQSRNTSLTSFNGPDDSYEDLYSFRSRQPSQSHIINTSGSATGISGIPTLTNHSNIQLINKMSSNIRRLEIEIHTLLEENCKLNEEKELLQQELMEKIKLEEDIESLNKKVQSLLNELDLKSKEEQTMLELIGEKSERVEELKADVQDLKEICKLQVQQMIELQGK
ncbi:uncharacterized protein PRCAT00002746001 [Priceomyces carsonii]|uniref:uncharacterized protein n=1 Tax=Priceomyces carsonii TaxID=28549 RepID=UPI002EDBAE9F|nr:unnamed protein product [Priceomyces carsonii]